MARKINPTSIVKKIVKEHYDFRWSYNDKRKDGTRRLKFMHNGWRYPAEEKIEMFKNIKKALSKTELTINSVMWKEGHCQRGDYEYFEVIIPIVVCTACEHAV